MKQTEVTKFEIMYGLIVYWYGDNISNHFNFSFKHQVLDNPQSGYIHTLIENKGEFHTISPYKSFQKSYFSRLEGFRSFATKQWILLPISSCKSNPSLEEIKKRGFGLLGCDQKKETIKEIFKPVKLNNLKQKSIKELKEYREKDDCWFGEFKNGKTKFHTFLNLKKIKNHRHLALSMNMSERLEQSIDSSLDDLVLRSKPKKGYVY